MNSKRQNVFFGDFTINIHWLKRFQSACIDRVASVFHSVSSRPGTSRSHGKESFQILLFFYDKIWRNKFLGWQEVCGFLGGLFFIFFFLLLSFRLTFYSTFITLTWPKNYKNSYYINGWERERFDLANNCTQIDD